MRELVPVEVEELREGGGGTLAHIGRGVIGAGSHGEKLDLNDIWDANRGHDSEGEASNERVAAGEVDLEGVDGEEGNISAGGVVVRIVDDVDVDHLLDLHTLADDILHDVWEVLRHVLTFGHHREKPFQASDIIYSTEYTVKKRW